MEEERLKAILESLLFAAGEPVPLARLAAVLDNVARDAIKRALSEMTLGYGGGSRGVILEEVAGGYQLRTPKEHALYVRRLRAAKPPRLSRPLLETLAIIAYRQPVTRPEIEQLRGVDSGGVLETLLERRLVRIAGRKEAAGRPIMYATSVEFLEVFGLRDLDGLPDLDEFKELEERAAQEASDAQQAADTAATEASPATAGDASVAAAEEGSGGDPQPELFPGEEPSAPPGGAEPADVAKGSGDDAPGASSPDPVSAAEPGEDESRSDSSSPGSAPSRDRDDETR
jgi:segregation and condensation protein B